MDVHVRVANPQDASRVRRLLQRSYPQLMASAYEPLLLERALPLMTQPNLKLLSSGTYYVGELDGTVVGCGGWSIELPGDAPAVPGVGHIRHFATIATAIRQGVGRAIYNACEASARGAGVTRLECQASLNAEPFYAALGFKRQRPIEVRMRPDFSFPSILMTREI